MKICLLCLLIVSFLTVLTWLEVWLFINLNFVFSVSRGKDQESRQMKRTIEDKYSVLSIISSVELIITLSSQQFSR